MALFRRGAKGRHALGAAVTSIPSGPLQVLSPPAVAPTPAAVPVPPAPAAAEPAGEPSVLASIAELIATGEAWASDLDDFHALHTPAVQAPEPVVVVEQVEAAAPPAAPPPAPPQAAQPAPLVPPPVAVPTPAPAAPAARASLEAALAELLPQQPGEVMNGPPAPAPAAPRVQLGFRDGTSTTLEPGSDQSRALEEIAQSLTRRD